MSKRKLLLADDSITIQKVVNLTFADEGIEVITVGDGDSAMEKLREFTPDLIMADVNMPGLTGYQICEQIRLSDTLRKIPVILLVGSFEPFDEEEANRVGANDFLTKPFQSIRQLVNKVTGLLNASENEISEEESPSVSVDSFAETLEMPKPEDSNAASDFGSNDFDDEMIQTNQVGGFSLDESHKFETREYSDNKPTDAETLPLPSEEVKDFVFSDVSAEASVSEESYEIPINEEPVETLVEESYQAPVNEEVYDSYATRKYSADEIAEVTDEKLASNDEIPEYSVTNEVSNEEVSEIPIANESSNELATAPLEETTDEVIAEDSNAKNEDLPLPSSASILDLDDDILELPPIEGEEETEDLPEETTTNSFISEPVEDKTVEAETSDEADLNEPVESLVESERSVSETPLVSEGAITLSQFSPELIDAIAQKVIEKLSDKAVKDVAWEVVPQMTELIVKQMAEEQLKNS